MGEIKKMQTFDSNKKTVSFGDVVILYLNHLNTIPVTVEKGQVAQTKYGAIKHDNLIGHQFGSKFECSKGWVYILNPTPELWTVSLPHRTQILYATDIAMVLFQLEVKYGSVVCESGTGSGSLSHSFLRAIGSTGKLYTTEFHEERSKKARNEFIAHGYGENVVVHNGDAFEEGFPDCPENSADAVFLDLPQSHLAIDQALKVMKPAYSRLCSFSPCMEQVQRTCEVLHKKGFSDVITMELVKHTNNVKRINMPIANLGDPASDKTHKSWPFKAGDHLSVGEVVLKTNGNEKSFKQPSKKQKLEKNADEPVNCSKKKESGITPSSLSDKSFMFRTCVKPREIYGHTGYLTFATLSSCSKENN